MKSKIFLLSIFIIFLILYILLIIYTLFKNISIFDYNLINQTSLYCSSQKKFSFLDTLACHSVISKKKNFIFYVDGLAFDQIALLKELYLNKSLLITYDDMDYKQSASIAEMIFTGKSSNNFLGTVSMKDSIFNQVFHSDYRIQYKGNNFPLLKMFFDRDDLNKEKVTIDQVYYREKVIFESLFINILGYSINNSNLNMDLLNNQQVDKADVINNIKEAYDKVTDENLYLTFKNVLSSIKNNHDVFVFYSLGMDHYNHYHGKEININAVNYLSIQYSFLNILKWADENPDVNVILMSDHGGQSFIPEDEICNHGCNKIGNEGFLLAYSKDIHQYLNTSIDRDLKVSYYQISSILSVLLDKINLPLEAIGIFPIEIFNKSRKDLIIGVLRQKEIQLKTRIESIYRMYNKRIDFNEYVFDNELTLSSINNIKDDEIQRYYSHLVSLQKKIESNKPSISIEYKLILSFILLVILLYIRYFYIQIKENVYFLIGSKTIKSKLVLIYSFLSVIDCLIYIFSNFEYEFMRITIIKLVLEVIISFIFIKKTNKKVFFFFFFKCVLSIFLKKMNIFKIFKKGYYLNIDEYSLLRKVNFLLYIIMISLLLYEHIRSYFYIFTFKIRKIYIFSSISLYITYIMIQYDYYSDDNTKPSIAIWYYSCLLLYFLFLLLNITYYSYENNSSVPDESSAFKTNLSQVNISFIHFFYFINDDIENIFMFIYVFPCLYFIINYIILDIFKTVEKINKNYLFFILFSIINLGDTYIFTYDKTFSYDVSIKSGNKTIGRYQDDSPIFTGVLFVLHKLQNYIILSGFTMKIVVISYYNKDMHINNKSLYIYFLIGIKSLVVIIVNILVDWMNINNIKNLVIMYIGNIFFLFISLTLPLVLFIIKEKVFSYFRFISLLKAYENIEVDINENKNMHNTINEYDSISLSNDIELDTKIDSN